MNIKKRLGIYKIYKEPHMALESIYKVPYVRGLRVTKNLKYCLDPNLTLDLFEKRVPKIRPIFIYFHGGGFISGDKSKREWMLKHLASNDYSVINVNYGTSINYPYPNQIQNCALALKWVEENAIKYSLDLNNIAIGGDGAGAFLATQLAILNADREYAKKLDCVMSNVNIKGLVLLRGVYDLTRVALKAATIHGKSIMKKIAPKLITALDSEDNEESIMGINEEMFKLLDLTAFVDKKFPSVYISVYDSDSFAYDTSKEFISKLVEHQVTYWKVVGITMKNIFSKLGYDWVQKRRLILNEANEFLLTLFNLKPKQKIHNRYIQYEVDEKELLKY